MAPPVYADLGKSARDVFGKGYHFSLLKLECKTKTSTGVEFTSGGSSNLDSGKVLGNLETKYKLGEYGLTLTERWNTDNTLGAEITIQDQIAKGLKITFDSTFAPQTGKKTGVIKTEFKHDTASINADVDLNAGPVVHGSAVCGYQGWLAGYQMSFDAAKSKLIRNNFAIAYVASDFSLHTNVNDGQEFGGAVYQKVNSNLETGVQLNWTAGSNATRLGLGCKYQLDSDSAVRAKINNASQLGLGYQQKLRKGVTVTLSSLIDVKNFNQGGHKLGMALELEA
jgi:voltage-dependent anion channel protein 2